MKNKLFYVLSFLISLSLLLLPAGYVFSQTGSSIDIKEVKTDNYPEVELYFSLVDSSGIPIEDLNKEDINLEIEGNEIADLELGDIVNTESPLYIALLLDNSGSMKGGRLENAKESAKEFISYLKEIDEVKIFAFNDTVEAIQDFTSDGDVLSGSIDSIEMEGQNTVLYDAVLDAARDLGRKPIGNRAIILLTDGKDDSATTTIEDSIDQAKENRVPIYCVGFGDIFNQENKANFDEDAHRALYRLAKLTNGKFFIAEQEEDLVENFNKISEILKKQYVLKFNSSLPKDGKSYDISLSIGSYAEVLMDNYEIITPTFDIEVDLDSIEDNLTVEEEIEITPNIIIDPNKFEIGNEIDSVKYYLDSESILIKEADEPPYSIVFNPEEIDYGQHTLILKAEDSIGREYRVEKILNISQKENYLLYYIIGGVMLLAIIIALIIILVVRKKKRAQPEYGGDFGYGEEGALPDMDITEDEERFEPGSTIEEDDSGSSTLIDEGFSGDGDKKISDTIIKPEGVKEFVPLAWLVIVKGVKEGKEFEIPPKRQPNKRRLTIGRNTDNDIVIDDETASRNHAFLVLEEKKYKIGDALSANGTFINGKKIQRPRILKDGDKINIGDSEVIFKKLTFEKLNKKKKKNKKTKKKKNKESK